MVAQSSRRVANHTDPQINREIEQGTDFRITYFREHPQQIARRLRELDAEWDVERMLQTMSASVSLFGLTMSVLRGRKWLIVPLFVQGWFLNHAISGWCPPLPVLRRMGFRTTEEIARERYALLGMQGSSGESPKTTTTPRTKPRRAGTSSANS